MDDFDKSADSGRWRAFALMVSGYEQEMSRKSVDDLRALMEGLARRQFSGAPEDSVMAEAIAVAREAARRGLGVLASNESVIAAGALVSGAAVDLSVNRDRDLAYIFAACVFSLSGKGVHVAMADEASARQAFQRMTEVLTVLGLRAGLISSQADNAEQTRAYKADVTYGGYLDFGYSYLRDNLAQDAERLVQSGRYAVIVDEIDSILVDQADRLIFISAPVVPDAERYHRMARAAANLRPGAHYELEPDTGRVALSGAGANEAMRILQTDRDLGGMLPDAYLDDALRARDWFRRDIDYAVVDGALVALHSPGGRLTMQGRYGQGSRQAIEAMLGLRISAETKVLARTTVRDYFRLYERVCGLSMTADAAADQLRQAYQIVVIPVGGAEPLAKCKPDVLYERAQARRAAVVKETAAQHEAGRPVIIGTALSEDGQAVSEMLGQRKVSHAIVSPDSAARVGDVMNAAGNAGAVTVLAGVIPRGHYVPALGDNVIAAGGPVVLGVGRNLSRRADDWLCGLAGQPGQQGECQFYLSTQDPLLRTLDTKIRRMIPRRARERADGAPAGTMIEGLVVQGQLSASRDTFSRMMAQLELDQVESAQREQIYSLRQEILADSDPGNYARRMVDEVVDAYLVKYQDSEMLVRALSQLYDSRLGVDDVLQQRAGTRTEDLVTSLAARVKGDAQDALSRLEVQLGADATRELERKVILSVLDDNWSRHLGELDVIRQRTISRDRSEHIARYTVISERQYQVMLARIKEHSLGYLFHSDVNA
jgi:preprotein translocase subunit SecA